MTRAKGLPHPKDVALGTRIRLLRELSGLSQESLGQSAGGISFQQIGQYERGVNRVGFSRLVEIAAALDMTVAEIIAPLDSRVASAHADYLSLLQEPLALEMLIAFSRLSPGKSRKAAVDFLSLMRTQSGS